MNIAPPHILKAANETVFLGCSYIRNITLNDSASTKLINEVMEAIHEIPLMLSNWKGTESLEEMKLHLSCFKSEKWSNSPNLRLFFEAQLKEHSSN